MRAVATSVIAFEVSKTAIDGLLVLSMKQVSDERGTIWEFFRESALQAAGADATVGEISQRLKKVFGEYRES